MELECPTIPVTQSHGIRVLPKEEIPLCLEIAHSFFNASGLSGELRFDYWVGRWEQIYQFDLGMIIVYESEGKIQGLMGGIICECLITSSLEAIEAFWYVYPEKRTGPGGIRLLKEFERIAKERGCVRIKMTHLSSPEQKDFGGLFQRMGYVPLETSYTKDLS